jgi:YVTN family beta-propeller protein
MKKNIYLLMIILIIFSCKTIDKNVDNIEIINPIIYNNNNFNNKIEDVKIYYKIDIDIINGKSSIILNSENKGITPLTLSLEKGVYDIVLCRTGYADQNCRIDVKNNQKYLFRHNKDIVPIKQLGIFECGNQPKQVIFSPDDKFIYIPLLADKGFQVFDLSSDSIIKFITPNSKESKGYAEGIFIKNNNSFCVSQMDTGNVYEYSYPDLTIKRTISTGGIWSKFMAFCESYEYIAISNWLSNNVSIIDYKSGKIKAKISTPASPRGLAFSNDSKELYITSFDGGQILKVDTKNWKIIKNIYIQNAAMRHIVLNNDNTKAYVSNMYHSQIYEIDLDSFTILKTYNVDFNPNTIDLSPDNRFLFVSSRGPNNPDSYLERSPRNGKITAIDVLNKKILFTIDGGNQPTGLDISNNGKYLCFSNFLDKNIELYWIGDL